MSWRTAFRAAFRLGLVLSVALSGMSYSAGDAEARRGGKVRSSSERVKSDDHTTKRKSEEEHDSHGADDAGGIHVPRVRSRGAARSTTSDGMSDAEGALSARRVYTPRRSGAEPRRAADIDVPGCPTGMICTVCLAGCAGDIGSIVDAQQKTAVPAPQD